jgi:hypothetical protein
MQDQEMQEVVAAAPAPPLTFVAPLSINKTFTAAIWSTSLFLISKNVVNGHRMVKCTECEQLQSLKNFDKKNKDWAVGIVQ